MKKQLALSFAFCLLFTSHLWGDSQENLFNTWLNEQGLFVSESKGYILPGKIKFQGVLYRGLKRVVEKINFYGPEMEVVCFETKKNQLAVYFPKLDISIYETNKSSVLIHEIVNYDEGINKEKINKIGGFVEFESYIEGFHAKINLPSEFRIKVIINVNIKENIIKEIYEIEERKIILHRNIKKAEGEKCSYTQETLERNIENKSYNEIISALFENDDEL